MAKIGPQRCLKTRRAWRAWLQAHHGTESELWLVLYKKHTGKASLVYDEAVEEALCFGWIDGIRKRIDEEKHAIRFTPRRRNSRWSALNKQRVAKMMAEGQMTEAGLMLVRAARENGQWDKADGRRAVAEMPIELKKALQEHKVAGRHFEQMAPSYRRQFMLWIADGKREDTRRKRVAEAVRLLTENKKLGMK